MYINGKWHDVYKDPVTDTGKRSKKGRLILTRENGKWETARANTGHDWTDNLTTVFMNGEILKEYTFDEIRDASNRRTLN